MKEIPQKWLSLPSNAEEKKLGKPDKLSSYYTLTLA